MLTGILKIILKVLGPLAFIGLMIYLAGEIIDRDSQLSYLGYIIFIAFGFLVPTYAFLFNKHEKVKERIKKLKVEGEFVDILKDDDK